MVVRESVQTSKTMWLCHCRRHVRTLNESILLEVRPTGPIAEIEESLSTTLPLSILLSHPHASPDCPSPLEPRVFLSSSGPTAAVFQKPSMGDVARVSIEGTTSRRPAIREHIRWILGPMAWFTLISKLHV